MREKAKRLIVVLVLLTVAGSLTACVRQKQYRYVNVTGRLPAIEDHQDKGYKVAFVEFKDNGDPHDSQQASEAVKLINAERKITDTQYVASSVVLIYVHGWKNNADRAALPKIKDVEKFEGTLEEIASLLPRLPDGRRTPLVGVYIGWHGKSLELPDTLNWVSFWPRGIAAGHVGGDSLTKTLNRLVEAGKAGASHAGVNPKVLIVGHSFGSRVLEQAEKRRSIQKGECNQLHELGKPIKPPVDLILFVNAATGSKVTREIIEECKPKDGSNPKHVFARHPDYSKERCENDEGPQATSPLCRPYPLFVSISSRSDYATKILLPVAALRLSAAHTNWLNTHRVIELKPEEEIPADHIFTFRSQFHNGDHRYVVLPKEKGQVDPFWIMTVDKNVISSHGDIWNQDFKNMLLNLMGQLQVVQMAAPAYQRLPSGTKARAIQ
ncbi:MAG: hypothetical protein ACJ74J_02915 [Blastocatellia bacterium]